MNELERLITEVSNTAFDCGEYGDGVATPEEATTQYEALLQKSRQAKQALLDYIEENYRRKDGR